MEDFVAYIFISIWLVLCNMLAISINDYLNERKNKKNEEHNKTASTDQEGKNKN